MDEQDIEPYPVPYGSELWKEGCPEWLARYEWIEARAERYLDNYRDSMEYDFTRTLGAVEYQQRAVQLSYERFAEGSLQLLGVRSQVKMLRDAYRRKVATPLTAEEGLKKNEKPAFVPEWRRKWEEKKKAQREYGIYMRLRLQPSPDKDAFLTDRGYYGLSDGTNPMRGWTCYSITDNEGYLKDGTRVSRAVAFLHLLWDRHEHFYPNSRKQRPEHLTLESHYEAEAPVELPPRPTVDEMLQQRAREVQKFSLGKRKKPTSRAVRHG